MRIFPPTPIMNTFFRYDLQNIVLRWFWTRWPLIFQNQATLPVFSGCLPRFSGILWTFSYILPRFSRVLGGFSGILSGFSTNQNFCGWACISCTPASCTTGPNRGLGSVFQFPAETVCNTDNDILIKCAKKFSNNLVSQRLLLFPSPGNI